MPDDKTCCQRCGATESRHFSEYFGQEYCAHCVDGVGLPEVESVAHFVEVVPGGAWRFIGRWLLLTAEATTFLVALLMGMFFILAIAFAVAAVAGVPLFGQAAGKIGNPGNAVAEFAKGMAMMSGMGWIGIAAIALPMCFFRVLRGRSRSYRTDGTHLYVNRGRKSDSVALSDCAWAVTKFGFDMYGAYLPFSPRIVVTCGSDAYVMGFEPDAFRYWHGVFELLNVQRATPFGATARQMLLGTAFGGCVGFLVGFLIRSVGGQPEWIWVAGVLGMLDGAVVSLLLLDGKTDWHNWRRNKLFPLLLASVFAAVGIKIGMFQGALANFGVGLLLGEYVRRRTSADTTSASAASRVKS